MIKKYYQLAKPGIIFGNAIAVIGAFLLASRGNINFLLLIETFLGISLVIGSGCVFNNYIDRDIDARMARTKNRDLVTGAISDRSAIIYGVVLGLIGISMLAFFTNWVTTYVAALGFFFYVVVYSLWAKRTTVYGTIVGSISGAVPPVVGYCAVSGRIDAAAVILFLILVFWQMPHFYAIAMYRIDEYAAAGVPVLPIKRGSRITKITIVAYIVAFIISTFALFTFGYTGLPYVVVALLLGLTWLGYGIKGFWISDAKLDKAWARKMFLFSLIVLTVLFIAIAI